MKKINFLVFSVTIKVFFLFEDYECLFYASFILSFLKRMGKPFHKHYDVTLGRAFGILGFIKRSAKEFDNVWVTKTL